MPHNRFYSSELFQEKAILQLVAEEHKHARVIRLSKGDTCEVVNGKGQLAIAVVQEVDSKKTALCIQKISTKKKSNIYFSLALGLQKSNHLDIAIEKATELGVEDVFLFVGDFSEKKKFTENVNRRLVNILLSASKQCGRLFFPKISFFPSIQAVPNENKQLYFGDTTQYHPMTSISFAKPVLFYIGPEKGFSNREIAYLSEEQKATKISLCKNTLRAETAAIAACAICNYFLP